MGTLLRAHGLKGELRAAWHADSPLHSGFFHLRLGAGAIRPVRVTAARMHRGRPLIRIEGVEDRTAALALRGGELLLPETELPADEDALYLYQLPGLEVVLHESGEVLGSIDRVETPAGREIWVIRTPDGREVLFPAVPVFVESVDIKAGRARVKPPPGLLDVYPGRKPSHDSL
jgi:16S rRNA processing protein RimM